MNQYSYCVNCGKTGHYNYQCKLLRPLLRFRPPSFLNESSDIFDVNILSLCNCLWLLPDDKRAKEDQQRDLYEEEEVPSAASHFSRLSSYLSCGLVLLGLNFPKSRDAWRKLWSRFQKIANWGKGKKPSTTISTAVKKEKNASKLALASYTKDNSNIYFGPDEKL